MKIAYILGPLAIAGIFGAGIYCSGDIKNIIETGKSKIVGLYQPASVNPLEEINATGRKIASTLLTQSLSSNDVSVAEPPKVQDTTPLPAQPKLYVTNEDRLDTIEKLTRSLFQEIKGLGEEKGTELYTKAQGKINQLQEEACQEPLNSLAGKVESVIAGYLPIKDDSCSTPQVVACLNELDEMEIRDLAKEVYGRLPQVTLDHFIKDKGLDFWLETLHRNFGVGFSNK